MFKDYGKYLNTSLKVYIFVLMAIFIMKIVGLDYFGLDINNSKLIYINNILENNRLLNNILFFIPLWFAQFIVLSITCNDNSKKMIKYNILLIPIYYVFEGIKLKIFGNLSFIFETLYLLLVCFIYNKKVDIKKFIKVMILITFVEIISYMSRYNYSIEYVTNRVASILLSLDYIIMLIIIYKINFMKGDENLCGFLDHQFYSLDQHHSSKKQLKKFQIKSLNKKEKFEFIATLVLYILWNLFTLFIVLLFAKLNNTFIECLFIVTSFLVTKTVFGKPFHLPSMKQCFIVSNLTYYLLNRLTTPLGISIFVPILLGVGLSYTTSKLVKKTYKQLYKGMPKELFEETILKVTDKESTKYKICYDFFIENKSALYLTGKYNYSEAGIRQIISRINKQIKDLK